ncbi:MAG: hypothetical protein KAG66_21085, partial [Methylococcales bacterium]|nr:hypothetical protein [Methylococcales bacterium]
MILNRLTVSALEMNDQVKSIGRNLFLVAAWIWLFRPIFPYLQIVFTRQDFRTNQITAVFIILLILSLIPRQSLSIKSLGAPAHFRQAPLLISIISAIGFLLNERFLDVNTLSASLFGLGSYGLLGLWLDLGRWRRGFPAALLL